MKKILALALTMVTGLASLHAVQLKRYEINVKDFDELKVVEGLRVDYVCNADSAGYVTFVTTPELASVLMLNNNNGTLSMQIATDGIDYDNLPTIRVYSRFLEKVQNSGDSLVRVLSLAPVPKFKARLIGNGHLTVRGINSTSLEASLDTGNGLLTLYGTTDNAKFTVVGTGAIEADDLVANDIKCSLVGTGHIGCAPEVSLSVTGASSGKVYYKGDPKIKNRSIGIKIIRLDENSAAAE